MTVLSDLHPHAKLASKLTVQDPYALGTFHVFTDGSCRKGDAGWAFAVICAQQIGSFVRHIRVGFAAGKLNGDLGPTEMTAQDAEATAIVAACEYILSRREVRGLNIHLHFDATAVGFGSMGVTNVVKQDPRMSHRQRAARILVSLVQRSNPRFRGCHVHAHKGHPWNELADSLAKHAAGGWSPSIPVQLRSADLLAHPLAEWAWLQISPDSELPCLEQIMCNEMPAACNARIDSTFSSSGKSTESCRYAELHFASINVGTLHQDQMMPKASVTFKAAELMHQFAEANLHFVGVQETRARTSCSKRYGSFHLFGSAGLQGQAGVELWINEQAISDACGFQFRTDRDVGVWHATPRILAATCHLGQQTINLLVVYAPQRGNTHEVILAWWEELTKVVMQCTSQSPLFVMGDLNCSIGTVESDFIGGVGAEFEDFAGSQLRELCQRFRLLVPSTKDGLHVGPSWTHMNVHGTCHRLDYILVAEQCRDGILESKVEYDIDVLNGDKDHKIVKLTMQLKISSGGQTGMKRVPLYDRDEARSFCRREAQSLFANMPFCSWSCDTNEHWSHLREHAQSECVRWFPRKKRTQRQLYFSKHAWNMLCHRKDLRQEHRALQQKRRFHDLKFFFSGWKDRCFSQEQADVWTSTGHSLNMQEAVVLEARRNVDVKFKHIKKVEWRQWVRQCLDQNISALQQAKVNEVHKILKPKRMVDKKKSGGKRPLPGLLDRHGTWQTSPSDVAIAWQKQFSEIEMQQKLLSQP